MTVVPAFQRTSTAAEIDVRTSEWARKARRVEIVDAGLRDGARPTGASHSIFKLVRSYLPFGEQPPDRAGAPGNTKTRKLRDRCVPNIHCAILPCASSRFLRIPPARSSCSGEDYLLASRRRTLARFSCLTHDSRFVNKSYTLSGLAPTRPPCALSLFRGVSNNQGGGPPPPMISRIYPDRLPASAVLRYNIFRTRTPWRTVD